MTDDAVTETPPPVPGENRKKRCLTGCLITFFAAIVGIPLVLYIAATACIDCTTQTCEGPNGKLLAAAGTGDLAGISEAIEQGASPDAALFGNGALFCAASKGHDDAVLLLLKHGADMNAKTAVAQRTALHEAALRGRKSTVELLLQNGADVNARNRHNRTPLYYVVSPPAPLRPPENHREIEELLRLHGGEL